MKTGVCQEQLVKLDDDENHEEPTPKRVDKRIEKTCNPQKKKKPLVAVKVPLVRVSDNGHRKIIVLNLLGLLCDIR